MPRVAVSMRTSQSNKAADGSDASVSSPSPTLTTPPNGRTLSQQQPSPMQVASRSSARMAQKAAHAGVETKQQEARRTPVGTLKGLRAGRRAQPMLVPSTTQGAEQPRLPILGATSGKPLSSTTKRPRVEEADAPDAAGTLRPSKRRAIPVRKDAKVPTPFNRVKAAKVTPPRRSTRSNSDGKEYADAPECRSPAAIIPWFRICQAGFLPDATGYAAYVSKLQDEDPSAGTANVQVIFWYHVVEAGLPNHPRSYPEYFGMLERQQEGLIDPWSQLRGYEPKYNPTGAPFLGTDGGRYRWHGGHLERSRDYCGLNGTNWYPIWHRRNGGFASSFLKARQDAATARWKESFDSFMVGVKEDFDPRRGLFRPAVLEMEEDESDAALGDDSDESEEGSDDGEGGEQILLNSQRSDNQPRGHLAQLADVASYALQLMNGEEAVQSVEREQDEVASSPCWCDSCIADCDECTMEDGE